MNRPVLALLVCLLATACGAQEQSKECKKLIDCANALEAGAGDGAYGVSYGADGTCWLTSNAADSCTETCQSVVESLSKRANAPAECK